MDGYLSNVPGGRQMFSVTKSEMVHWQNWSGSVHCNVNQICTPFTVEELAAIVKKAKNHNKTIRVVGAGHSFTPLVATGDVLISLKYLRGVEGVDKATNTVSVWGGTTLKELSEALAEQGYAMENMGDINLQTIAGAISTGTHGTGAHLGNIPTQITGITLMTATGELETVHTQSNQELFQAAQVSLGMLGIIIKAEIKVLPQYSLIAQSYRLSFADCLKQLDALKTLNRNFEFYWFPYTETVQVKTMNRWEDHTAMPARAKQNSMLKKLVIENGLLWVMSEASKRIPKTYKAVSTMSAMGVPVGSEVNTSHLLYATPRLVKFQEMEYAISEETLPQVLQEIKYIIKRKKCKVHFPIECRFVKQDHIWLSPSYGRNSAYVAVHMYKGMPFNEYFSIMEEIFRKYGGRPHWGKMHTCSNRELQELYPKLQQFLDIRKRFDSAGVFMNDYLQELFQVI